MMSKKTGILKFGLAILPLLAPGAGFAAPMAASSVASRISLPITRDEKWTAQDEADTAEVIGIMQKSLIERTGEEATMKRDAHPKHHGCVKARFKVDNRNLPADLRQGIFAYDQKEFNSWVRFSNGQPDAGKADAEPDVRGMAIKLLGVPEKHLLAELGVEPESGTMDLVMMNSKVFFIKDLPEYRELLEAVQGGAVNTVWFMLTHGRSREVLQAARNMEVGNPLHIDYFSATPYKLGSAYMKFGVKSCVPMAQKARMGEGPSHDFLGERLASSVANGEACFDFYVQVNRDPRRMPIEDPTVEWSEREAPYLRVATLRIPRQTGVSSAEQMNFCENLSFNPWRTIEENRPVGAINRARFRAYVEGAELRRRHNGVSTAEPSDYSKAE
jgi:hypothetical protein